MGKISRLDIYVKGSIVALVIGVPAVISFLIAWIVTNNNLMISIVVSIVTYFVSMGFAIKVARRLAKDNNSKDME